MAFFPRSQSLIPLALLLALGLATPGCDTAQAPLGVEVPPTTGWLAIEAGADGASAWVLRTPAGSEITGVGDSLIADPQEGEYWLLWEPVEEWNSPTENPTSLTFTNGSTEVIEANYARISGDMGNVEIDVTPNNLQPQWNLYGPDGFFAAGKGSRKLPRRAVGQYRIVFADEPGYQTPTEASGQLMPDATLPFTVTYEERTEPTGTVRIDAEPDALQAQWQLSSSAGGSWSGRGDATLDGLSPADYTISWSAVSGYDAPAPATASLAADDTLTFQGSYTAIQATTGSIRIDPNPDALSAQWQLVAATGGSWNGSGDQLLEGLEPGSYTITWGAVPGYLLPDQATATLEAGQTLTLSTNYIQEQAPKGTVVINPDPDALSAPWTLGSDIGVAASGSGDSTLTDLPVATYVVIWGDVPGYVTPSPETAVLSEGARLEFATTYGAEADPVGTIVIDPNPDSISAPWQLVSDTGTTWTGNGDSTLADLPLGTYTLTWGDVQGYRAPSPNPVVQTLSAGAVAVFALE